MIVYNLNTNRLCRFVELEMFAGIVRAKLVDLKDGGETVAVIEKVAPYAGVVVDFERRV